ncbi:MAG: FAD-dependent oxidoreductase [Deltaproteobacteria bacterium]|nr:FAD-dependent oxidoreductase [Deltaproteobacteria bacterium]
MSFKVFLVKAVLWIFYTDSLSADMSFDVVVYKATPAGISAAVSVKRLGKTVLILEPAKRVGGMMTNGLGASDVCLFRYIGGFAREFFNKVGQKYGHSIFWRFEPKVSLAVFEEYLRDLPMLRKDISTVSVNDKKIASVTMEDGTEVRGKIFIDASYEGDLLAIAGASYRVSRESSMDYNESLAGFRLSTREGRIPVKIKARDGSGDLHFGVQNSKILPKGTAHHGIMAYNFRLCLTRIPSKKVRFRKPLIYDRKAYHLHLQYIEKNGIRNVSQLFRFLRIPGGKYDLNNRGPFSSNFIGENWDYPEANKANRKMIVAKHKSYLQGLLYFLANDPAVPFPLRRQMSQFGLCRDEFVENGNWPEQLYVRVGRRLVGEYVLRQDDIRKGRRHHDTVGIGTCPIEGHIVQRLEDANGFVISEGFIREFKQIPYSLPYRIIIPKRDEVQNLLVPVAVSATYIAYSALRMEPTFMILGQSAGIAAVLAIDSKVPVQEVSYLKLRQKLIEAGQRLSF